MEGPCASDGEEDEETLQEYAARRLQLAELPTVEISAAELDSVRARVCPSVRPSVRPSVCPSARLPVCLSVSHSEVLQVYEPSDDTFLLLDALEADRERLAASAPAICVEIGCGSGVVITSLSKLLPSSRCTHSSRHFS